MKKKQIGALVIAVVLFIITGVASVMTESVSARMVDSAKENLLEGGLTFAPPEGSYIGVVDIVGTIQEQTEQVYTEGQYQHTAAISMIDSMEEDPANAGLLLYVDSPGGTVYESREMYDRLIAYKEKTGRPVYAYMAHYGASGAYMISMAADRIYANLNTTTGSIGVIMTGYDLTGLYKKLGIRNVNITSGRNKAASFSEEQVAVYQSQVDEYFDEFVRIVADGRNLSEKKVRKVADGRTYTAKQALEKRLIDEICSYNDAEKAILKKTGAEIFYRPERSRGFLASLLAEAGRLLPKSENQVLKETAEEMESGVFMYYAQL